MSLPDILSVLANHGPEIAHNAMALGTVAAGTYSFKSEGDSANVEKGEVFIFEILPAYATLLGVEVLTNLAAYSLDHSHIIASIVPVVGVSLGRSIPKSYKMEGESKGLSYEIREGFVKWGQALWDAREFK